MKKLALRQLEADSLGPTARARGFVRKAIMGTTEKSWVRVRPGGYEAVTFAVSGHPPDLFRLKLLVTLRLDEIAEAVNPYLGFVSESSSRWADTGCLRPNDLGVAGLDDAAAPTPTDAQRVFSSAAALLEQRLDAWFTAHRTAAALADAYLAFPSSFQTAPPCIREMRLIAALGRSDRRIEADARRQRLAEVAPTLLPLDQQRVRSFLSGLPP